MSFNQSRSDRSETQYRKSGRSASFNQQRSSSGSYGKGGGGGPAPSPTISSSSSSSVSSSINSSNRGYKKPHNAQGAQSRVNSGGIHTAAADSSVNASGPRNVQNGGGHLQQTQLHGASDALVGGGGAKSVEPTTAQRSIRVVPKAPTSQPAAMSTESGAAANSAKAAGDASKGFHFQFGSIGMQIPARTSSAPPNLDEQKRDQARHDTYRAVPNMPPPSLPKQQMMKKDPGVTDQSNTGEVHPIPKAKKDPPVPLAPAASQTQKSPVLPIPLTSMQMPFHQSQVSVQFGGHNPSIQSQNVTTSLQMPMPIPLPMGSGPQVQQHMFVPGLQPHPMQPQSIMHQGQGLSFTAQMGPPQMAPQLGNLGMGIAAPQYPQQQGGKYVGPRKTVVKITHPDTHKEVRLDERADAHSDGGVSTARSHSNVPQSQPIPSYSPAHPINYYPNSYNPSSMYFATPGSMPLTSNQMPPNSQAPRYSYPIGQGPQNLSFMNPAALNSSMPVSKTGGQMPGVVEPPNLEHSRDIHNVVSIAPPVAVQVTVKPAQGSMGEKATESNLSDSAPALVKSGSPRTARIEANVSLFQKESESISGKSVVPTKHGSEVSVSKSSAATAKQSAAVLPVSSGESLASNTLSSRSDAPSEETSPAINMDGRKKETISRTNSIKDNLKKPVKKGQIQPQAGGQSTTTASSGLAWKTLESVVSSNNGVSEAVESKTSSDHLVGRDNNLEASGDSLPTSRASNLKLVNTKHDGDSAALCLESSSPQEALRKPQLEESTVSAKQEVPSDSVTSKFAGSDSLAEQQSVRDEVPNLGTAEGGLNESASHSRDVPGEGNEGNVSLSDVRTDADISHGVKTMTADAVPGGSDAIARQSSNVSNPDLSEAVLKNEGDSAENMSTDLASLSISGTKDQSVPESNKSKNPSTKGKKKRREYLLKADAAGSTSDLYNAYKGPEDKKESAVPSDSAETSPTNETLKQLPAEATSVDTAASGKSVPSKAEPDDWEDAADISTPKLEPSGGESQSSGRLVGHDEDLNENMSKKYSRDFLMKFCDQCTELPDGFGIATDIADVLMSTHVNASYLVDRDSYPSPGRMTDRQSGGPRIDRRGGVMLEDDRWGRMPAPSSSGRDMRLDVGYGANVRLRPGQGGNFGVLRNAHAHAQMIMQYGGGILPMQAMGPQGVMPRNSPDADRWQRATNFQQKGLIPSPNTPLQTMHKAERKYEVGKVADEEEAKQRQLKAILNKLTPQNFEKLFEQVKAVNIDNAVTLTGVINQIFDKALMEPTFCEMYANFCYYLAGELPDFSEDNEKITFKRLLLNKCQEEFERGEREQEEANKDDKEGEVKQTAEEREEKRVKARRRMLGNIRLIGELYKKKMLTERIMHECIKKLLGQYENPDEEDVEALCKLMSTIGEMIDHPKAKEHMDAYFDRMTKLSNNMKLSSRVRFMLKDAIELRKNKWQQRRKVEGPKKIEEVHRDAAQERQAQTSRLARGSSMNSSSRRGPMDYAPRGSAMLASPTSQMGSFRGLSNQARGYAGQDVRIDDRQSYDARTVPLPQRPLGDDSITLGPQGGLARGMSIRGMPAMQGTSLADIPSVAVESRRMAAGLNGFSSLPDRSSYGTREELVPRYVPDRFGGSHGFDQMTGPERDVNYGNRDFRTPDRSFDRPAPAQGQPQAFTENVPPEKGYSEERLRDKSMAAIKEFYSARDEKEVALCIKELNSPGYHPSLVSLWVSDSFERKDVERDLLAKLLVNLSKPQDNTLSPVQLIKGFESVLSTLEDAVNDAPKAPEFLGRIFAKVIVENVIPLNDIGQLLYIGGEEPGRLREAGLAGDVLGSTLEMIRLDKGDNTLTEIRSSSNLKLEDFRPPDPMKSRMLEKFI